jgi:hypothetical protein
MDATSDSVKDVVIIMPAGYSNYRLANVLLGSLAGIQANVSSLAELGGKRKFGQPDFLATS